MTARITAPAALTGAAGRTLARTVLGPPLASFIVAVVCLGVLTFGSLLREGAGHHPWRIALAPCSFALGLLVFVVVDRLARRCIDVVPAVALALGLMSFAASEAVRTIAYGVWVVEQPPSGAPLAYRVVAGGMTGLVVFGLGVVVRNGLVDYRRDYARLAALRTELAQALESANDDVVRRRDALVRDVRTLLTATLDRAFRDDDPGADPGVATLDFVDTIVRPLSRRLERGAMRLTFPVSNLAPLRISMRRAFELATTSRVFSPWSLAGITFALAFSAALFGPDGPVVGVTWLLLLTGWICASLSLADRTVGRRLGAMPPGRRVALILGIDLLVAGGALTIDAAFHPSTSVVMASYWLLLGVLLPAAIAMGRGFAAARRGNLADIDGINGQLARVLERSDVILWADQRELARAVHRDVQSGLVAAAWRYKLDVDRGVPVDLARTHLLESAAESIERLGLAAEVPGMRLLLARVRDEWDGICAITGSIDDDLAARLDADPATRRVVAELISELMTNAVKHGAADRARVRLRAVADGAVDIDFWNNGRPIDESYRAGFGLSHAAERSRELDIENLDSGVRFRLTV